MITIVYTELIKKQKSKNMRNSKSTLAQTAQKLSKAQIIASLVAKNLKGGTGGCPPPRLSRACPPPRL